MWVIAIAPWKCIKGLSWVLNKWQRFVYPLSFALFYGSDAMDKTMPTVRAIIVWAWNASSLALHFVDVILIFVVINVRWVHFLVACARDVVAGGGGSSSRGFIIFLNS